VSVVHCPLSVVAMLVMVCLSLPEMRYDFESYFMQTIKQEPITSKL
jgi:hypothetical protein